MVNSLQRQGEREAVVEGSATPRSNLLLSLLPDAVFAAVQPCLEQVPLSIGSLQEAGRPARYCVFPTSGLIGRVAMGLDGKSTELTLCGYDGLLGVSVILGGGAMVARTHVIAGGAGYRLPAAAVKEVWKRSDTFQYLMLRYTQFVVQEIVQIALCNRHHSVEQQLSRWLLMATDRIHQSTLQVTQTLISYMLGVRREGITEAVGKLEAAACVTRQRGSIHVRDRSRLETRCCECYAAIRRLHDAMTGDIKARMGSHCEARPRTVSERKD
jgi:hypothetical protein